VLALLVIVGQARDPSQSHAEYNHESTRRLFGQMQAAAQLDSHAPCVAIFKGDRVSARVCVYAQLVCADGAGACVLQDIVKQITSASDEVAEVRCWCPQLGAVLDILTL